MPLDNSNKGVTGAVTSVTGTVSNPTSCSCDSLAISTYLSMTYTLPSVALVGLCGMPCFSSHTIVNPPSSHAISH